MKGYVIWYHSELFYGTVKEEGEEQRIAFVHHSDIQGKPKQILRPGEEVEFDLYEDEEKGLVAKNVKRKGYKK